jgi:hypothetical protein
MQQGPDLNVSWDELTKSPDYQKYASLYGDVPYQTGNYSDALIDWGKFGVNRNIPMGGITAENWTSPDIPQWTGGAMTTPGGWGEWGPIDSPTPEYAAYLQQIASAPKKYGDISLSGNSLLYKGSPFTGLYQYDRDPTEAMGAIDPRVQLVMNDAKGWNDPLSNWIQSRGITEANNLFGNLNYRARNGDSSSAGFDPQAYYVSRLGPDAAKVLHADPEAIAASQAGWNSYMSPGAQSDRADAMFGGGGFLGDLGPISSIAAMIPGPWQPFAMALNAANSLDQGNILGAVMSGAGAISGFGGMDFGGGDMGSLGYQNAFDTGAMSNAMSGYEGLGGLSQYAGDYSMDMGIPDTGYVPMDFPTDASGQLQFDDAMQQDTGFNSPDSPLNQIERSYNQTMAENPLLEKAVKYGKIAKSAHDKLKGASDKEDAVAKYMRDMQDNSDARQEKRSESARNVKSKRKRNISALAGA